jgi:hypothetical protein
VLHIVTDDLIVTANLGDSRGIVVGENHPSWFKKLNRLQNANSKREQSHLRRRFPYDNNIVTLTSSWKEGDKKGYYVKVRNPSAITETTEF